MDGPFIGERPALQAARPLVHPGYVAGRWYLPDDWTNASIVNTNTPNGSMRLIPVHFPQAITISDLMVYFTTASASGKLRCTLYAENPTTQKPTGSALIDSGDLSTTATGQVTVTLGAPVAIPSGWYWWASNADILGGSAAYNTPPNSIVGHMLTKKGVTSAANLMGSGTARALYSYASAYGAPPDLTAATMVEATSNYPPLFGFKVSGVGA